jgi:hypothetical protein
MQVSWVEEAITTVPQSTPPTFTVVPVANAVPVIVTLVEPVVNPPVGAMALTVAGVEEPGFEEVGFAPGDVPGDALDGVAVSPVTSIVCLEQAVETSAAEHRLATAINELRNRRTFGIFIP